MRNEKGQKLGKRKQKRILAKIIGIENPIDEIDQMNLDRLKKLAKKYEVQ